MSNPGNKEHSDKKDLKSDELQEVGNTLEKLSKKEPKLVSEFMALAKMGSISNPLHEKLSDEHLGKIVDLAVQHDERQYNLLKSKQNNDYKDKQSDKKYYFAYFTLGVFVFLIVLVYLKDTPDLLIPTLTGLGGLVSGFLAGLGFRRKD
ncbi:MAG: hypothetical protein LAT75_05075 [Candidatus Cyclonatronum sp.]|uniref:hypothetical protein n=1 Tax=Cyclonatronum sp. TaxID=3024185 RepID=UPI0025BC8540|nr:hypothetical protein [Cyclonatronum sp.]MCC5934920.1 hypothetical protein [Balneolales bacterium]MCH8486215.1 hypothetical protein [Cyclonatronum sp.]